MKNILMSVDCTYCLEQAHRTAITLLSVLFALQFFSRNIDCTLLGFRQSQLYSFINKRLGVEVLNVTKPFIRQYICHFIPPSNLLCKKRSSYFILVFTSHCSLVNVSFIGASFCIYLQILFIPQATYCKGNECLFHPYGIWMG